MIDATFTIAGTTRGLISYPAYRAHLAGAAAKQLRTALQDALSTAPAPPRHARAPQAG